LLEHRLTEARFWRIFVLSDNNNSPGESGSVPETVVVALSGEGSAIERGLARAPESNLVFGQLTVT